MTPFVSNINGNFPGCKPQTKGDFLLDTRVDFDNKERVKIPTNPYYKGILFQTI